MSREVRDLPASGVDLMKQISQGTVAEKPSDYLLAVKEQVTTACEELLTIGARIRPLKENGKIIAWARGVHPSERRLLRLYYPEHINFSIRLLLCATTLPESYITSLTSREVLLLSRVVAQMSESDMSLYPYILAFSTTSTSDYLWRSGAVAPFTNRDIKMLDGSVVKILTAPDHTKLWYSLCTIRDRVRLQLDGNLNALLVVKALVGNSANSLANELNRVSKELRPDAVRPWSEVVKVAPMTNVNDGWAHLDDSLEGLQRELKGMLENDRHERVIDQFHAQQVEAAKKQQKRVDDLVASQKGIIDEGYEVLTEDQVRQRSILIRKSSEFIHKLPSSEEGESAGTKLGRYQ